MEMVRRRNGKHRSTAVAWTQNANFILTHTVHTDPYCAYTYIHTCTCKKFMAHVCTMRMCSEGFLLTCTIHTCTCTLHIYEYHRRHSLHNTHTHVHLQKDQTWYAATIRCVELHKCVYEWSVIENRQSKATMKRVHMYRTIHNYDACTIHVHLICTIHVHMYLNSY